MTTLSFLNTLTVVWFVLAAITFVVLQFVVAPYGRHMRSGWGPSVPSRWAWVIMEMPMPVLFGTCFIIGEHRDAPAAWALLVMWEAHYLHRAFIYPFTLRSKGKRMPLLIAAMAFFTNIGCAYMNGWYLFGPSGGYLRHWVSAWQFRIGVALFALGFFINRQSDAILRRLRAPDEVGYKVPYGGLFRWVSCPNYLGEIVEWIGWAVASWSPTGLAFAAWTIANLVPRARAHHLWYHRQFPDYPSERKALLPGIW